MIPARGQHGPVSLLGHAQLPQHERECQASSGADVSSIKRDNIGVGPCVPSRCCYKCLYGFKAARRATRAADSAPRPSLSLARRFGRANAGRLARKAGFSNAANDPQGRGVAADLTRDPRDGPDRANAGRPEASPIARPAYGPSSLVKSAAPFRHKLTQRRGTHVSASGYGCCDR